jgi:hypothetical protein
MRTLGLVALFAMVACGGDPSSPAPSGLPRERGVVPVSGCDAHAEAFRAAMRGATGTCASDGDCGCFNPVVSEASCGGVTDGATATRLGAIERAFRGEGCDWPQACAPWACQPACREGRCVNTMGGGLQLP